MRPTAKDLARAAGVSLATVDRVLNERPNVSKRAAEKVQNAIDRIGFVRNPAAVHLARSTIYRFQFVLPEAGDQYLDEILKEIEAANRSLRSEFVEAEVHRAAIEDPHAVANYLSSLSAEAVNGVAIMAPESPQVRDAVVRLVERGIKVVQFLSGTARVEGVDYVGVDNFAAGATAARIIGRFCCGRPGSIMVISQTMRAQDSLERRLGFDAVINKDFPNLRTLPSLETHADMERTKRIVGQTFAHNADVLGLYVLSSEARAPLSCVDEIRKLQDTVVVVHERTPYSEDALRADQVDAIIAQNPGHAVRSAIRFLRARTDNREPFISQESLRIEILLKDNL